MTDLEAFLRILPSPQDRAPSPQYPAPSPQPNTCRLPPDTSPVLRDFPLMLASN
jgi:hypothetical protein